MEYLTSLLFSGTFPRAPVRDVDYVEFCGEGVLVVVGPGGANSSPVRCLADGMRVSAWLAASLTVRNVYIRSCHSPIDLALSRP